MTSIDKILKGEQLEKFLVSCSCAEYERNGDIKVFRKFAERVLGLEVTDYHLEWIKMFYDNPRTCITAHRGSGKTTILAIAFILWITLFKRDQKILVVSANMRESIKIVNAVRSYINSNELLLNLKPKSRELAWSKQELDMTTNCKVMCRPYTINIRGEHVNYLLADEGSLYQDLSIFRGSLSPMVDHKDGHIMVIGTPLTEIDLIAQLNSDPSMGYVCKTYKAIKEDGTPLWPTKFNKKKLEKIKTKTGSLDFSREYMCEVVAKERQIFPPKILVKSFNINLALEEEQTPQDNYYMGADLALSPEGDYSVFTIIKKSENLFKVSNIFRQRGLDYNLQAQYISDLFKRFDAKGILIDSSVFGSVLIDDLRQNYQVPADGMSFTPSNRNLIIDNLRRLFEGNLVIIPRKNDGMTLPVTDELIKELSRIVADRTRTGLSTYKSVGAHDDMFMSLALACYGASSQIDIHEIPIELW